MELTQDANWWGAGEGRGLIQQPGNHTVSSLFNGLGGVKGRS